MDELPRDARDVLALAQSAHDPSDPAARDRVRQRVALAVAAAAGASAAGTAVASAGSSTLKAGLLGASTKLWIAGGVLVMSAAAVTVPTLVAKPVEKARTVQPQRPARVREAPVVAREPAPMPAPAAAVQTTSQERRKPRAREAGGLEREMALLREASLALDQGQLRRARVLLSEHRRDFRAGQLRDEREGLEVLRACLADERTADRAAKAFLSGHPQAVLGARIRTACEGAK